MIKHIWTVLAQTIITDTQTNLMSYVNCIEEISPPSLPVTLPIIGIGTIWEKDSNEEEILKVKISLVHPSGKIKEIFKTEDIHMDKRRHRLNIIAGQLMIEEEGEHKIQIEVFENDNWVKVNSVPFFVQIKK